MKMRVGGQIAKSKLLTLAKKKEGGLTKNLWIPGLEDFLVLVQFLRHAEFGKITIISIVHLWKDVNFISLKDMAENIRPAKPFSFLKS